MKKTLLISSLIALSVSSALHSQETDDENKAGKQWIGVFGQYYWADDKKFPNFSNFSEGGDFGVEYGYRFTSDWAARLEYTSIEIDESPGSAEIEGTSYGADALYFLNESETYVFGGVRYQDFYISRKLATIGLGKHWRISDDLNIITEFAGLHDFGQNYQDLSAKLGISYSFGQTQSQPLKRSDSDNDGVEDYLDRCPNTAAGAQVDALGCKVVVDTDGDGVINENDQCPETPAGQAVNAQGCVAILDSDNDGVPDNLDACVNTPTEDQVDALGCSIFVEKEVSETLRILFASESAKIDYSDATNLKDFVAFLRRYRNTDVMIEGHASAPGTAAYNLKLSEERAQSVKQLLVDTYGIDPARISTEGYGETQLIDTSNTKSAHEVNRRIVAKVTKSIRTRLTQ